MDRSDADNSALAAVSPPGALQRLSALVVDWFLLALVGMVVLAVTGGVRDEQTIRLFIPAFYVLKSLQEWSWGRTIGKAVLGLEVHGAKSEMVPWVSAFIRNAWLLAALVPIVGSVLSVALQLTIALTIGRGGTGQGWNDQLAGTSVRWNPSSPMFRARASRP